MNEEPSYLPENDMAKLSHMMAGIVAGVVILVTFELLTSDCLWKCTDYGTWSSINVGV